MTPTASRLAIAGIVSALLLTSAACTTNPDTGEQTISRGGRGALAGAAGGALLGALIGGDKGALVGAGVGSVAGGAVGGYMDRQERALRAAAQGTDIEVKREGNEIALNLPENITFDFNSAIVKPQMRSELQEVAGVLREYNSTLIGVYGHTDNVGSAAVNDRLSLQRAEAVAGTLESFGVPRARMLTRGFGFNQPIASNATAEGRAQNRRVELRIVPVTEEQMRTTS
jgi:outer membrane protein OmpA-like peptidoglycan-associated protein